jgi:signal transduction histidine kinase
MKNFSSISLFLFWPVFLFFLITDQPANGQKVNEIEMHSVIVDGKDRLLPQHTTVNLGPFPGNVDFYFNVARDSDRAPVRIRYKLGGYDNSWQNDGGEMHLSVRFYGESGDLISQKSFPVSGESAGWNGSLKDSPLTHRRETLTAPPFAYRVMVVISSAGPPATVGIYTVANLVLQKISPDGPPVTLLQSPFDHQSPDKFTNQIPDGWIRDGLNPSMAKIVKLGQEPVTEAFAIIDDSLISHAEWHNIMESAPKISAGDHLAIEWNELFSIGLGDTRVAIYKDLPIGTFQFQVEPLNVLGVPTGGEAALSVLIPAPFWKTLWFWGTIFTITVVIAMATGRYFILRKVRLEISSLEKQRMLERERVRIAHDIHDDLGARVTQISLVSAMARTNAISLEQARADFDQISGMSRDLVTALYETVWAVNPENDNLNELGNYLFQMANKQCELTSCRCRFYIQDLPREIIVQSQIRHNICMAVKEAINNTIKHAQASEIIFNVTFIHFLLTISIQDDGSGFKPDDKFIGNGLNNLRQRMKDIGGVCLIESGPGRGTTIQLQLEIKPAAATA